MEERPIITPAQWLALEGVSPEDNQCTVAVVAFCPFHSMKDKARARPLGKSLLSHIDAAHQFQGVAGDRQILMIDCVYGGPVCATVAEDMAYLGVKYVIGYGYSGSLRPGITPGSIMVASSAFVSDGTSREYCESSQVEPSRVLVAAYEKLDASLRAGVIAGKAWTTDAIYREYPSRIRSWIEAGADFVNMDTSTFYAVSRVVSIQALYFSLISDYVGGEKWEEQFWDIDAPRAHLQDIVLKLAAVLQ